MLTAYCPHCGYWLSTLNGASEIQCWHCQTVYLLDKEGWICGIKKKDDARRPLSQVVKEDR